MVRVLDHAGAVLIGCRSFAEEVSHRLGTDPARFTIVPGAVDVAGSRPAAPGRPPVLLYHGRVDARKGVLDMLDALAPLAAEGVAFELLVSGIGPTYDEAAARIGALGLGRHARMTGYVDYADVPEVYRRADIFVSPTYAEGSPTRSWRRWRAAWPWCRAARWAWWTASGMARTACSPNRATCRR